MSIMFESDCLLIACFKILNLKECNEVVVEVTLECIKFYVTVPCGTRHDNPNQLTQIYPFVNMVLCSQVPFRPRWIST